MGRKIDLSGKVFGKLLVLKEHGRTNGKRPRITWACTCSCGQLCVISGDNLAYGHTKSCGCSHKQSPPNKSNIVGKVFGRLTVIEDVGRTKHGMVVWLCKCLCGNYTKVPTSNLTSGHTRSCGCLSREINSRIRLNDLTGVRFGRLVVIERCFNNGSGEVFWHCVCDCGEKCTTSGKRLRNGQTKSCGCLHLESVSGENNYRWKDDRDSLVEPLREQLSGLPSYNTWRSDVISRNGGVCFRCGSDNLVHVHHILPFSEIISLYNIRTVLDVDKAPILMDVSNGVTLCKRCHLWVHSNENKYAEFLSGEGR